MQTRLNGLRGITFHKEQFDKIAKLENIKSPKDWCTINRECLKPVLSIISTSYGNSLFQAIRTLYHMVFLLTA